MNITPPTTVTAIPAESILPLSIPGEVVPVGEPDSPPAERGTGQPDMALTLVPRDLEILREAPVVLEKDGVAWFDTGADGIEISAAGDAVAFTHRSNARILGPSPRREIGFGVPAAELASIARWSLRQTPSVGLDLAVHCAAGEVTVTPNRTLLTDGWPLEACLVGVPESPLEWEGFFANELETWPLTAHFERPPRIAAHEEQEELGQLDRVTLVNVLSSVRDFIPKGGTRRDLEVAELHDGILYGGGLDVAFWCTAPSLAGIDLSLARQQLHPLLRMLRLLPSRTCRVARNRIFNIFSNSRTTIYAKILDSRHPAPISRLLNEQPEGGVTVDASSLRQRLVSLRKGRGNKCPDAFFHAKLTVGHTILKTQGLRPSDGKQTAKGRNLLCQSVQPGLELNLLTPLTGVERALTGLEGSIDLRAGKQHLYVSGPVPDAPSVVRTVRLPAVAAHAPDRLASQVRQIARWQTAASSPDQKRRAAS